MAQHQLTQEDRARGSMGHRGPKPGRPHALADPEYAKQVAALFVAGTTRADMAATLGVDETTISRWRRDPRVKAHAIKLIEDRVIQITRKVDSAIEQKLQNASDLTVKELIEIRKEFLAGNLRSQAEKIDEGTVSEAMEAIEKNPELADQILALLNSAGKSAPEPAPVAVDG